MSLWDISHFNYEQIGSQLVSLSYYMNKFYLHFHSQLNSNVNNLYMPLQHCLAWLILKSLTTKTRLLGASLHTVEHSAHIICVPVRLYKTIIGKICTFLKVQCVLTCKMITTVNLTLISITSGIGVCVYGKNTKPTIPVWCDS